MSAKVVFADIASAGLKRALNDDPRLEIIKRALADRARFTTQGFGRSCDAFPGRSFFVDRPSAGVLELRVLLEVETSQTTIWSIAVYNPDQESEPDS